VERPPIPILSKIIISTRKENYLLKVRVPSTMHHTPHPKRKPNSIINA